jgi:glycosyltransferase involved in cell wall biosynthesis
MPSQGDKKRLLILTQKVDKDDDLLGFFHRWIEEFAHHCDHVIVVCLEEGAHELPSNVRVLSLGKEENPDTRGLQHGYTRIKYVARFYKHIWHYRKEYDTVFVHMNREYVLLGGLLWRMLGKKITLWWVHFETPLPLRIAERLSHIVFTASKESFQLKSKKKMIVGHGIDLSRFEKLLSTPHGDKAHILYVGKITPIKNVHILFEAAQSLALTWPRAFQMTFVGPTTTDVDEEYKQELLRRIKENKLEDTVVFRGSIPYAQIHEAYKNAHLVLNSCPTGGIDKMVVEAMASRTPVIVANETFRTIFGEYADDLLYPYQNAEVLAEKIKAFFKKTPRELKELQEYLHKESRKHSLENLITRIAQYI